MNGDDCDDVLYIYVIVMSQSMCHKLTFVVSGKLFEGRVLISRGTDVVLHETEESQFNGSFPSLSFPA